MIEPLKRTSSSFIYASLSRKSVYKVQVDKLDFKEKKLLFKLSDDFDVKRFKIKKSNSGKNIAIVLSETKVMRYNLVGKGVSSVFDLDDFTEEDEKYNSVMEGNQRNDLLTIKEGRKEGFMKGQLFQSEDIINKKRMGRNSMAGYEGSWVIRDMELTDSLVFLLVEAQSSGFEDIGCIQGTEFMNTSQPTGEPGVQRRVPKAQKIVVLDSNLEVVEQVQIDLKDSIGRNLYFGSSRMHSENVPFDNYDDTLLKSYLKLEAFQHKKQHYLVISSKVYTEEIIEEPYNDEGSFDYANSFYEDDTLRSQDRVFKSSFSTIKHSGSSSKKKRKKDSRNIIKKTVKFVEKIHLSFYRFDSKGQFKMKKTSSLGIRSRDEFKNFESLKFIDHKSDYKIVNFFFIAFFKNKAKLYSFDQNFYKENLDEINLSNTFFGMNFGWQRTESEKNREDPRRSDGFECVLWNHGQIAKLSLLRESLPVTSTFA